MEETPNPASTYGKAMRDRVLLPTSEGGMGFQNLAATAGPAFVSSLALVSQHITGLLPIQPTQFSTIVNSWGYKEIRTQLKGQLVPDSLVPGAAEIARLSTPHLQREIAGKVSSHRADKILEMLSDPAAAGEGRQNHIEWMRTTYIHVRCSQSSVDFLLGKECIH